MPTFQPFRDASAMGETKEEALKNIKEAIELYLEVLEEKELGKTMKKFVQERARSLRCPYDKAPGGVSGKDVIKALRKLGYYSLR